MLLGFAVLLLLTCAWLGVRGGITQWPQSHSLGERTQTLAQFAYGVLSLVVVSSLLWERARRSAIGACWLASLTVAGGVAPVVWGGTSWIVGVVAGLATLGLGVLILWLLTVGTRGLTRGWSWRRPS